MRETEERATDPDPARSPGRTIEAHLLGRVPYGRALELQAELVGRRRAGAISDRLLLLEHPHVITMGSGSVDGHVLADEAERARLGIELHRAGRGGDVTYHGPGQLVGYPIMDLKPDRKDLHGYLRDLEEVLIRSLGALGITGRREEGLTGVWTDGGKVAAIGVRVSSGWITSHGFALNVSTDLSYFRSIVPCGIADRTVTSVGELLGRHVEIAEVVEPLLGAFGDVFSGSVRVAGTTN